MLAARIAFAVLFGLTAGVPSKWGADRRGSSAHAVEIRWPDDVAAQASRGIPVAETNAERIKRGLTPRRPSRLYDPSRTRALEPRYSSPPPTEGPYTFSTCASNIVFSGTPATLTIVATSNDIAASTCAVDAGSVDALAFSIKYDVLDSYTCIVGAGISSFTSEDCTETNAALYFSS